MTMYVNPVSPQQPREEARIAAEVAAERRRAERMKQKFMSQATPWAPGTPSVPFDVIINDISDTGVGLIHDHPMNVGMPHLLNVPRGENASMIREYVVVRCNQRGDGKYSVGMTLRLRREEPAQEPKRVCSKRLKLLFLLFGIFGLIIASLAPL
jgi:hypothetical protein